jgi:hypothetical protein
VHRRWFVEADFAVGIVGHLSGAMLSRNSHVRMEAKRRAIGRIQSRLATPASRAQDQLPLHQR